MKIIDNKGKLFGLINVIDLLVLLIIVLAVGGVGYKLKNRPTSLGGSNTQKVTLSVEVSGVRQATVDGMQEEDKLFHYDRGNYFGQIKKIEVLPYKEAVATSEGKVVLADVPEKFNVFLEVESDAAISDSLVVVGGEHTRIGSQFRLKNKKIAVFGTVLKIDENNK
ncbi:DUF4330 domain-containing protein [Abyssisolibacter fermentans]|uniref:DUF4330 domain-containing protein n=1 Tax=Abyssisolibacter fermentans TaxID=1766203 RepID=UPI000831DA70|nr:DUF4330 domain-containing protein [Abyssisolibacter fermentans]